MVRRLLWLFLSILTCLPAQPDNGLVKREALEHPSAFGFLEELNDRIGPRLTGSPEEAKAGEWGLRTMRAIGLQNVHPEPWQMEKGWRRGHARARMLSPFGLELSVTSYGWAGSTSQPEMEAEVVAVDSNALADEARRNATGWAGKVLLVSPADPKRSDFLSTAQLRAFLESAVAARAVAVFRRDRRPGTALTHTGPLSFPLLSTSIPVLDITREQEQLIARILKSGTAVRLRVDVANEFTAGPVTSNNIVGEIPGSQHPEETILLGAHLDSWDLATGAIDDGFGVAAVLGAAKSIVASGVKPDRTIRVVLFTGEEEGLLGSRAYVRAHQREMKNFVCALVLDWGNGPITKFPLAGHNEMAAPLEELFRSISEVATIRTAEGYLTYTDAFAFTLAGVAGIAPLQDSSDYTLIGHSAADTLDKVNPEVLTRDAAVLAMAGIWFANSAVRAGSVFTPEKTAESLAAQRAMLQALGLWPFSDR
jgi:hypothetical protein